MTTTLTAKFTSVREGRSYHESRIAGLPIESNFIVECEICHRPTNVATINRAFADDVAREHETRHLEDLFGFMAAAVP